MNLSQFIIVKLVNEYQINIYNQKKTKNKNIVFLKLIT